MSAETEKLTWGSTRWSYTKEELDKLIDLFNAYGLRGKGRWWVLADALEMNIFKNPNTNPGFIASLLDRINDGTEREKWTTYQK